MSAIGNLDRRIAFESNAIFQRNLGFLRRNRPVPARRRKPPPTPSSPLNAAAHSSRVALGLTPASKRHTQPLVQRTEHGTRARVTNTEHRYA